VRAEKVGCRFCGTFCALVDAMLPWWACETFSTSESCKHVHEEPCSLSEVGTEHCGSTGGRDRKWSAGPWTRPYLVAKTTKRGLLFDCMSFFSSHASQPARSALSVWVDWIYQLDHCCNGCASPVSRDPRAFRRFSHSQPFFSEYRRNSHICHLRDFGSWRTSSDAPTSFLGQVLVHEIYL